MIKTVVCLQYGDDPYTSAWVNRLYRQVSAALTPPFRFVCFTDDKNQSFDAAIDVRDINRLSLSPAMRGIWWKLAVSHPAAQLEGQCLFLDLDIVILDNLDVFFFVCGGILHYPQLDRKAEKAISHGAKGRQLVGLSLSCRQPSARCRKVYR